MEIENVNIPLNIVQILERERERESEGDWHLDE